MLTIYMMNVLNYLKKKETKIFKKWNNPNIKLNKYTMKEETL